MFIFFYVLKSSHLYRIIPPNVPNGGDDEGLKGGFALADGLAVNNLCDSADTGWAQKSINYKEHAII
jgi:hypothetical protein